MKRTYQPKALKAARKHGYLKRSSTAKGKLILKKRRDKKRKFITKTDELKSKMKRSVKYIR